MSKFSLTVVDDYDYRVVVRDCEESVSDIDIVYEEQRGNEGWIEKGRVGPFSVAEVETLIKRLNTAKDILEEED